jgi:hypothetical protein
MGCHFAQSGKAHSLTHRPMTTNDLVLQKKVRKFAILILIPASQNPFYIYHPKHDFFEILDGTGKIWPSKRATEEPSRFWMVIESREIVA